MSKTCLQKRLESLDFLAPADLTLLEQVMVRRDSAEPGELVVVEGQELQRTRVIIDGWAYRYRSLPDGTRQILNFLIPGDIFGFFAVMMARSDCGIEAITEMELAHFPASELVEIAGSSPRLILSLSWIAGQSERMLDEQITRLGRRDARDRIAHLLAELFVRLRLSGFGRDHASWMPLTQTILADALGMSVVHANRSFRALAKEGLLTRENGGVRVVDIQRLADTTGFDRTYLDHEEVPSTTRTAVRREENFR